MSDFKTAVFFNILKEEYKNFLKHINEYLPEKHIEVAYREGYLAGYAKNRNR
jgi:hypothetical protein